MRPTPVVVVTSMDPVLRDAVATNLLCDLPAAVVVRHDLAVDGVLNRTVYDIGGVRERAHSVLNHGCLTCAVREDVLPTLSRLLEPTNRPDAVVLALPVTAAGAGVHRALTPAHSGAVPGAVAAGVVAAADPATLFVDLFGDDLLADRDAALSAQDRRAVGEALVEQVEFADVVAVPTTPDARQGRVLAHLATAPAAVQPIDALDVHALLHARRPDGDPRGDVLQVAPTGSPDGDGVWTLDLRSPRPLHPERLLAVLEVLGVGPLRGRGVFWLPTRPDTVCAWNGAGGQLAIGSAGRWSHERRTHLVITGVDHDPQPLRRAFHHALLTDTETTAGPSEWTRRPDGLDAWLGESRMSA